MPIVDPLPITPFTQPVRGEISLPGSKSITNRALILAALCQKPVTLTGALFSEDTQIMAKALNDLGFSVSLNETDGIMSVAGQEKGFCSEKRIELFVGNAGTAARFLTAFCAAAPRGVYEIDGIPQMHRRPMKGLIDALRSLGADIRCLRHEGFFPIEIHAQGLKGGAVNIDASESSQMLSALIMAMSLAQEPCEIHQIKAVREPFVNMTLSMVREFGFESGANGGVIWTRPANFTRSSLAKSGGVYAIEADASSASYFLALPVVVTGSLTLLNLKAPATEAAANLQGDGHNFMRVMGQLGAKISAAEPRQKKSILSRILKIVGIVSPSLPSQPTGVKVSYSGGKTAGKVEEFREFSDTFLTLAAISPLFKKTGPTKIFGIEHTRKQETDRIDAMATELKKIMGDEHVRTKDDSIEIFPIDRAKLKRSMAKRREPLEIETYNDHRVAMSFAILGSYDLKGNGKPWLSIKNPGCCAKTFPHFFELLEHVRKDSHSS